jgi:hypothetical protein
MVVAKETETAAAGTAATGTAAAAAVAMATVWEEAATTAAAASAAATAVAMATAAAAAAAAVAAAAAAAMVMAAAAAATAAAAVAVAGPGWADGALCFLVDTKASHSCNRHELMWDGTGLGDSMCLECCSTSHSQSSYHHSRCKRRTLWALGATIASPVLCVGTPSSLWQRTWPLSTAAARRAGRVRAPGRADGRRERCAR